MEIYEAKVKAQVASCGLLMFVSNYWEDVARAVKRNTFVVVIYEYPSYKQLISREFVMNRQGSEDAVSWVNKQCEEYLNWK